MTGTSLGETATVTVAEVELRSTPATVRISAAWKHDGNNGFYVSPTKTSTGKRTVSRTPDSVDLVSPLVSAGDGSDLLFTTGSGVLIAQERTGTSSGCWLCRRTA